MSARVRAALLSVAIVAPACDRTEAPVQRLSSGAEISGGGPVVARVGRLTVPSSLVAESARARGVEPRVALESLLDDAVAAEEALARGVDSRDDVRRALDAALARQITRRLRAEAIARGPVDDRELEELTALHWKDVALPERVRVVHVVVLRPKKAQTPEAIAAAKALAEKIHAAVTAAPPGPEAFEKEARSIPTDGLEIKVERLPPFVRDGRVAERDSESAMNQTFAAAAFTIGTGETGPVVETPFGWHVIRVLERLPEESVPVERRREMFAAENIANRARLAYEALITDLRKRHPPTIETFAESALASVQLPAPPPGPAPVSARTATPNGAAPDRTQR